MTEITHEKEGETYKQIVSPQRLISILREQGDNLSRPKYFAPGDEWRTGNESCFFCSQIDKESEHEAGCPKK